MFGRPTYKLVPLQGDINVQNFWRAAANLRRLSQIHVAACGADANHDRADRRGHTPASLVKTLYFAADKGFKVGELAVVIEHRRTGAFDMRTGNGFSNGHSERKRPRHHGRAPS
jgi:hypothetical protein